MNEHIIINDLPANTCYVCEKPFLHRQRYWKSKNDPLKEVEFIVCHPICRSNTRMIDEYQFELSNYELEKKAHSREVRELNKKIKKLQQDIVDVQYKIFVKKYS